MQSASGNVPTQMALNYVDHKRSSITQPTGWLNILVLATLLLTDGRGPVVDLASQQIREALEDPSDVLFWSGLLAGGRRHIADLHERQAAELERQRSCYENKLEERRSEAERLSDTVQRLHAEIAAGREMSRMDILQDILMVVTETLQSLHGSQDSPEQMLRRVEANLKLALRAGGGEEFGTVDDIVPYDPLRHHAEHYVPSGTPVRISSPGSIIPGNIAGDRVLLKAGVVGPAEVN